MILITYIIAGVIAGILAGWIGAGGGVIIIPLMLWISQYQHIPFPIAMHLAVATSLAFIMVNALYSSYKHHRQDNIIYPIVKSAIPTILIGAVIGALLGKVLPSESIKIIFLLVILAVFIKTFIHLDKQNHTPVMPSKLSAMSMGATTGILASLVGIGGSGVVNPYMQHYHYPMKNAAAMSATLAFPMGFFATIATVATSIHAANLPSYSLGYLYLPAFIGLLIGSLIGTPIGVRIVKKCPENLSVWLFRLVLVFVIIEMI
ncbi:sulfite exporter TauE/SafE family protein [Thiotrichales bacterium 19S3-7]|nr:sulfite exporter TauE/SafE family protein [Thiotrichales bacterium 19S3-7]MCF6800845.1 sulfite exporter TauE/SafE family protein [Thiotrichales bacterium 19S3-11]